MISPCSHLDRNDWLLHCKYSYLPCIPAATVCQSGSRDTRHSGSSTWHWRGRESGAEWCTWPCTLLPWRWRGWTDSTCLCSRRSRYRQSHRRWHSCFPSRQFGSCGRTHRQVSCDAYCFLQDGETVVMTKMWHSCSRTKTDGSQARETGRIVRVNRVAVLVGAPLPVQLDFKLHYQIRGIRVIAIEEAARGMRILEAFFADVFAREDERGVALHVAGVLVGESASDIGSHAVEELIVLGVAEGRVDSAFASTVGRAVAIRVMKRIGPLHLHPRRVARRAVPAGTSSSTSLAWLKVADLKGAAGAYCAAQPQKRAIRRTSFIYQSGSASQGGGDKERGFAGMSI